MRDPFVIVALVYYGAMSLVSLLVYGADKRAAIKGTWRIKERTMHTIDLLGGWPGGLLAQKWFRHKRRKRSFMVVFWLSASLHAALWALMTYLWIIG